jgi:hypothetical protein
MILDHDLDHFKKIFQGLGKSHFAVGIMGMSRFCCGNCGNLFVGIMGTYFFPRNCGKIMFFFFSNFAVGILGTSLKVQFPRKLVFHKKNHVCCRSQANGPNVKPSPPTKWPLMWPRVDWGLFGGLGPIIFPTGTQLVHKAKIIEFAQTKCLHRHFFCVKMIFFTALFGFHSQYHQVSTDKIYPSALFLVKKPSMTRML